jgi:hypothetical protein
MYKDRIKKWGLDKKNKERDMVAILRKKTARDAVGKESSFRVRGQPVTMDDVLHYFKRKKGTQDMGISAATTPSDISCWTPSPSRVHMPQPIDNGIQVVPDSSRAFCDTFQPFASAYSDVYADVSGDRRMIMSPFIVDRHIARAASNHARIPRSLSPPPTLLAPELLLSRIKIYFEGSFESGTWTTNESGYIDNITSPGTKLSVHPNDFLDYIWISLGLVQMGSLVEFRRVLSKAFNLVQEILRAEHPITLCCLLVAIFDLLREGHPEIVSLLRSYINKMAKNTIGSGNPWGEICRLMGMLEGESLEQALVQCWKCMHDTFKHSLGQFNPSTIYVFTKLNQLTLNLLEEERVLRELLVQAEHAAGVSNSFLILIMHSFGRNLGYQGKYPEAEELGRQILGRTEDTKPHTLRLVHKVEALELIAWMQYYQKKNDQAEKTMREVIEIIVDGWGLTDPWAINTMIKLEQWLWSWGRDEDAENLKVYREGLIGKDEIDEQSDGEQNAEDVID